MGLESGQIMGINKNLLDPRRPSKELITNEEKEEGVIAYEPSI